MNIAADSVLIEREEKKMHVFTTAIVILCRYYRSVNSFVLHPNPQSAIRRNTSRTASLHNSEENPKKTSYYTSTKASRVD